MTHINRRTWFIALLGVCLTSCSWILGDDLDGLKPFPPDAAADARSPEEPDAGVRDGAAPDVRGTGVFTDAGASSTDVAIDAAIVDRADAPERDALEPDAAREGGGLLDAAIADHLDVSIIDPPDVAVTVDANSDVTDGRAMDAPFDSRNADGDGQGPAGDGGITGSGAWVIGGAGSGSRSQYEVHGWMKPTTVLRATTRSGLTIEGYLQ